MRDSKFQIPNSKFQNLRFKFVFVALVLLLFSCSPEDNIGTNSLAANTSQLKKELKLDKFTSKNISENLIVNWETAKEVEKNNFEIIEIELSEKNKHELKSDIFQEKLKYELITIKSDSIIHSYLIEAYSSLKHSLFSNSIQDLKNFTGTLNVFELNGSQINQIVVYNGRAVNPSNNSSLYLLTSAINSFYESKNLNSKIPECNVVLAYYTQMWEEKYYIWTNKTTGQLICINYGGRRYLGTQVTYMSTPYACDAAGDAVYQIQSQTSYRNFFLQDHIAYDVLDPCPKEVMGKLVNTTDCQMAQVFNKLNADFSKYLVNVVSGNSGTNPAITKMTSPFCYLITMSNDRYTSSTKLYKAANLLHEMVHAYFLSLVDDNTNNTATNPAAYDNLPTLFQAFCDKNFPLNPNDRQDIHHEEMANNYVNAIANALQEYNKINDPNGLVPYQVYSDLAWGGLYGTPVYDKHFENKADEKARVENRYACEQVGSAKGVGTTNVQTPIGKPCN